jgi:hypothetical protein
MLSNTFRYSGTAYGYGGKLEGLKLDFEAASTGPGPTAFIASVTPN